MVVGATVVIMNIRYRSNVEVVCRPNLPLDTDILFTTIMATKMPYIGRG